MTRRDAVAVSAGMGALLHQLRRDGDRLFGSRRVQVVPLSFESREFSDVARAAVTTPTGSRHVFAKLLKPKTPGHTGIADTRARLQHEFEVTRHLFLALNASTDLRAVEPVAVYEDLLGIVTREAPGVPLHVEIGRSARWPATAESLEGLERSLARIGRWVRAFQAASRAETQPRVSLSAMREYIDTRLQRLVRLPRAGFGERDRAAVLAYIDRRAADVPAEDLDTVPVHGDITPSNILVTPDRVTVLDFAMASHGSRYFDIARLYTQLDFYTAKPQFRADVVARLQRAALGGFDGHLAPDNPLFDICAVQHVVCHLLSHSRQPGRFPVSLYSRYQCRLHRRWLRQRIRQGRPRGAVPEAVVRA